jgi:hypothetical protein
MATKLQRDESLPLHVILRSEDGLAGLRGGSGGKLISLTHDLIQ